MQEQLLPGDDLVFSGHVSQTDCEGLVGSYASITVEVFTAIYLAGDVETEVLNFHGGALQSTADGQDITVTEQFDWSDGYINSNSPLGTYSSDVNIMGSGHVEGVVASVGEALAPLVH